MPSHWRIWIKNWQPFMIAGLFPPLVKSGSWPTPMFHMVTLKCTPHSLTRSQLISKLCFLVNFNRVRGCGRKSLNSKREVKADKIWSNSNHYSFFEESFCLAVMYFFFCEDFVLPASGERTFSFGRGQPECLVALRQVLFAHIHKCIDLEFSSQTTFCLEISVWCS